MKGVIHNYVNIDVKVINLLKDLYKGLNNIKQVLINNDYSTFKTDTEIRSFLNKIKSKKTINYQKRNNKNLLKNNIAPIEPEKNLN